jgi:hypothetical protein
MVSVMAIGSKEFGSCNGDFDVSVENKNGGAWLCYGYKAEVYLVRNSGFELAANKRDSARYWQPFTQCFEVVEEIKSPCDGKDLSG